MLILGLAGGTAARTWQRLYPEWHVVGVEIDGGVLEMGKRFMGLPDSVETHVADARVWLRGDERQYDVIIVDTFEFPYIPFHLTTHEFFTEVKAHLSPGGAVLVNVGRDGKDDRVVHAIGKTLQGVFAHLERVQLHNRSNAMLVATEHAPAQVTGTETLDVPALYARQLDDLARAQAFEPSTNAPRFTDDHAPVEWLTDLTLVNYAWEEL